MLEPLRATSHVLDETQFRVDETDLQNGFKMIRKYMSTQGHARMKSPITTSGSCEVLKMYPSCDIAYKKSTHLRDMLQLFKFIC
jgi:hypothetical protein